MAADNERTIEQLQKALEAGDTLTQQEQQRLALYIKQNEELKKGVDYLKEQIKNLQQQQQVVNAISDQEGRIIEKERVQLDLEEAQLEVQRKQIIEKAKGRDLTEQEIADLIEIEKRNDKIREGRKDIARAEAAGEGLAKLLGISESNKNSLTYQLFANPDKVFDGFKGAIQDAVVLQKQSLFQY